MPAEWESWLSRWSAAGLIDTAAADRIRGWEAGHEAETHLQWPVLLAVALGALLLVAGILLFVSAHWDMLSPFARMALVLLMVTFFHAGGALMAGRFEGLAIALHTGGTLSLGAAIALTGQIFNLSEHWPTAMLLWTAGAAAAWLLLGHWTQGAIVAILAPLWLASEWELARELDGTNYLTPVAAGVCSLACAYLAARRGAGDTPLRQALGWLGGAAILPSAALLSAVSGSQSPPGPVWALGWSVAIAGPLCVAWILRRAGARWNLAAAIWVLLQSAAASPNAGRVAVFACYALGAIAMVAWGLRDSSPARVNLGMAGFAITVLSFYFSSVMDKLGRSASLVSLGLLFLGGGWVLEQTRRGLIARMRPEPM